MKVQSAIIIILFAVALVVLYLRYQTHDDTPILRSVKSALTRIDPRVQDIEFEESTSSYTEDKSTIFLCVKDKNGRYYDMNTLIYVSIHELAHVFCQSVGHTPEFHKVFNELLKRAVELNMYDPEQPIAKNYCGVHIPHFARNHRPV